MTLKALCIFVVPVFVVLLIGFVHVRTINRSIQTNFNRIDQKNAVMEGEVYRLKEELKQKTAKLSILSGLNMEKFSLSDKNQQEGICLYYNNATYAWYADAQNASSLKEGWKFTLYIDHVLVGTFAKIADVIGLPQVGNARLYQFIEIGVSSKDNRETGKKILYELELPPD